MDRRARMHSVLGSPEVKHSGISIRAQDHVHLSSHFTGWPGPEEAAPWREQGGFPVLGDTVAAMVCCKHAALNGRDHTLFLGLIVSTETSDRSLLLYAAGRYSALAWRRWTPDSPSLNPRRTALDCLP